jgi:hypothetical protein
MRKRASEELPEEGTYFNQMSREELEYYLSNFQTFTQKRKREKAARAYNKSKDARRNKKYTRKNSEREELAFEDRY